MDLLVLLCRWEIIALLLCIMFELAIHASTRQTRSRKIAMLQRWAMGVAILYFIALGVYLSYLSFRNGWQ